MSSTQTYEAFLVQVASLDRDALIARLSQFPGNLRLDFSPEFLTTCPTDQLRHLLLAALWRCEMKSHKQ
jgi:hypothetical protein